MTQAESVNRDIQPVINMKGANGRERSTGPGNWYS